MCIFIFNTLSATQGYAYFSNNSFKDHVWIKTDLQGQDKFLVGWIYCSNSVAMETSIPSHCSLLQELNDFTHLLICGDLYMQNINWSNISVNCRNMITHVESTIQDLNFISARTRTNLF